MRAKFVESVLGREALVLAFLVLDEHSKNPKRALREISLHLFCRLTCRREGVGTFRSDVAVSFVVRL